MTRIPMIEIDDAQGETRELLERARSRFGALPNFVKAFASSPSTLAAYLGLQGNLSRGALEPAIAERIALAIGEANECQYCVSAHTAISRSVGLDKAEIEAARTGESSDARAQAAVRFAKAVRDNTGELTAAEFADVRAAGFGDAEIVEIIAHVGMNSWNNLFAKAAQVDIDFPKIELLTASASA